MSQSVTPENPEKNGGSANRAARGAALVSDDALLDPDLQAIVDRWPDLPDAIKIGILALVRAASGDPPSDESNKEIYEHDATRIETGRR